MKGITPDPTLYGDVVTGNGGWVRGTYPSNNKIRIEDIWDLQPFKDNRSGLKFLINDFRVNLFGKEFELPIPKSMRDRFRNMEGSGFMGGKPFKLDQTFDLNKDEIF